MRKTLLRILLLLVVTVWLVFAIEGFASIWTKWHSTGLPPAVREASHCEYDPELGWRHLTNKHVPDLYGPGVGLQTNGQRLRGDHDHDLKKGEGKYRILCLGDSFTMGYGVGDQDTYPALLGQSHPSLETINMGLGAYGLDQCYLWYQRDGAKFGPDVLLWTFIADDFYRMNPIGNVALIPKPILQLVDDKPVPINVPVSNILMPTIGRRLVNLWHISELCALLPKTMDAPVASTPVAQQRFAPIALRMFEILRDQARQRGQLFVLGFLPIGEDIVRERSELVDGWLKPELDARGIALLDLRPAFRALPRATLPDQFTQAHYSRSGNLVAAKALLEGIRALDAKCPR